MRFFLTTTEVLLQFQMMTGELAPRLIPQLSIELNIETGGLCLQVSLLLGVKSNTGLMDSTLASQLGCQELATRKVRKF